MSKELLEMSSAKRKAIVKRLSEVMEDEFGVSPNSISDFWILVREGGEYRYRKEHNILE